MSENKHIGMENHICFTFKVRKKRYVERFLGKHTHYFLSPFKPKPITHAVGWGYKPTAKLARRYASRHHLPYIALEDGFIRSLGLGAEDALSHSLIADYSGIYYDATKPSDLEKAIMSANIKLGEPQLERARHCIEFIKAHKICKYNTTSTPLPKQYNHAVLVVDQTYADDSIGYGLANEHVFKEMLLAAIKNHPGKEILVKVHPDVVAGKKKGHLLELAKKHQCTLLTTSANPWDILAQVDDVYVVTSQLGFEALLAGKNVHCFGLPFYAGWGLTNDNILCQRRGVKRSLEQVFYCAYIQYCHYINPYLNQRCEIEDTLRLIACQIEHRDQYQGQWQAIEFTKWKQAFVPYFLGPASQVEFIEHFKDIAVDDQHHILIWSSKVTEDILNYCRARHVKLYRMEDGFLRSRGLGASGAAPLSLVIDKRGIYYDATAPSDLENILKTHDFEEALLERARRLRHKLVNAGLSKYNVGETFSFKRPQDKRVLLVPGQVETDASIAKGSPNIKTNVDLLNAVRADNEDAYIIYKPHPDVLAGLRSGALKKEDKAEPYDLLLTDVSITELFDYIDEVHTMSSLSGFEALLRDKKVVTYGLPFYAGWGLTEDKITLNRRQRQLSLEALIAATLILYPIYISPQTGDVCDVETAIELLINAPTHKPRLKNRLINGFHKTLNAIGIPLK